MNTYVACSGWSTGVCVVAMQAVAAAESTASLLGDEVDKLKKVCLSDSLTQIHTWLLSTVWQLASYDASGFLMHIVTMHIVIGHVGVCLGASHHIGSPVSVGFASLQRTAF